MKRLSSNRKTTQKPRQTEGTLVSLLPPHRKKEFRIFLGLTGYFHIWIPHRGLTTNLFMRFSRDPKMNPRNGTPLCGCPSPYSRQPSPPLWPWPAQTQRSPSYNTTVRRGITLGVSGQKYHPGFTSQITQQVSQAPDIGGRPRRHQW